MDGQLANECLRVAVGGRVEENYGGIELCYRRLAAVLYGEGKTKRNDITG